MKKRWTAGLLAALLLSGIAAGCARSDRREDQGLKLWFPVAPGHERLSGAMDSRPYEGDDRSVPGLLAALLAGPPAEDTELCSLIPPGTRVLNYSLEGRVANVELSSPYAELVGVDLTLTDYCITLTLTQLSGVDGVRITVHGGGQTYRERQSLYPADVILAGAGQTPEPSGGAQDRQ